MLKRDLQTWLLSIIDTTGTWDDCKDEHKRYNHSAVRKKGREKEQRERIFWITMHTAASIPCVAADSALTAGSLRRLSLTVSKG